MKRYIFTKLLTFIVLPALLFSFAAMPVRTTYTGEWKLNEDKSELGDFGARFAPRSIKVDQKDAAITIAKTSLNMNEEEATTTETLSFDGKESESTGFFNSKKKSTLKWADDEKSFTISYTIFFDRDGETTEIKGTETWTLSDDGKTLTAAINSSSPQGEWAVKYVYDKQ